jgi:hypothetical protein
LVRQAKWWQRFVFGGCGSVLSLGHAPSRYPVFRKSPRQPASCVLFSLDAVQLAILKVFFEVSRLLIFVEPPPNAVKAVIPHPSDFGYEPASIFARLRQTSTPTPCFMV